MAQAVAEGVRETSAEADIKRVPKLVPEDVAKKSGYKLDQAAPIASVAELRTMTQLSLAPELVSASWHRKCATSWTRPADFGQKAR
jgi:hypothetical protein